MNIFPQIIYIYKLQLKQSIFNVKLHTILIVYDRAHFDTSRFSFTTFRVNDFTSRTNPAHRFECRADSLHCTSS